MSRALLALVLAAVWGLAAYSGWVVGYVTDYVNGTSRTELFFMFENGTLIPLAGEVPWGLVGSGVKVYAVVEGGVARVVGPPEALQTTPLVQSPVRGPQLVTVVAAKFKDAPYEPYNYSYIHDVVFGPFPSVRDFWEVVSGRGIRIRPYYTHWGWVSLPKSASEYCGMGSLSAVLQALASDVVNILYQRGVQLPNGSYLFVVLNSGLPCDGGGGRGTIRFWRFSTPYGERFLAVSWIYNWDNSTRVNPPALAYIHEFGHNLGLHHSGTVLEEYDNFWDVMGQGLYHWVDGWWLWTGYWLPGGLSLPHKWYLGWGSVERASGGAFYVSGGAGAYWEGSDGTYTAEYRCGGVYEQYIDFCGVIFHKLGSPLSSGRWVFFVPVFNVTERWSSGANFLDVGQSAWVGGQRVSVVWRNSTHTKIVLGDPTLDQLVGANATFVVGAGAATIDSVAAVYIRSVMGPSIARTKPLVSYLAPFAYLDGGFSVQQVRRAFDSMWNVKWVVVPYPGVVVSVGGPLANGLTRALNPPDRPGVGGLPFFFDSGAGGIRDARTGQLWRGSAAVVAAVANGSRVYLLVWGLSGEDTRRAGRWLAECVPPRVRAVVINTTDFRILASWPSGAEGPSVCPGYAYTSAAVVGAGAASIDAVGAAMVAGGVGVLDAEADLARLPPVVYSVGGPLANRFTAQFNPVGGPGYGGLPFYYDPSAGGIRDARTGAPLCTSNCFVVAKLQVGPRTVYLVWGLGGEDTRAAAAYLFHRGSWLTAARGHAAVVARWSYIQHTLSSGSVNVGLSFVEISRWP